MYLVLFFLVLPPEFRNVMSTIAFVLHSDQRGTDAKNMELE